MIRIETDRQKTLETIDRVVRRTMQMDLTWDWPCGVAMYGVSRAYAATGETAYLDMLRERVDMFIALGLPPCTVNRCAMGHCLLTLYEQTGDEKYLAIIRGQLTYLTQQAPRFDRGVLQHTVSVNNDFPEQAWADTLFMAAFFMLRAGVMLGDASLVEDALLQYQGHIHFLQDKATGLWYHGYSHINRDHLSGFFWARANAWAAYTMSQVRYVLPEPYLYPPYMDVDCSLRDQLAGLKLLQTESGLWRTVLDDEESYEELSASCGIAAAMMANGNPLHTQYALRALDGIMDNISPDGRLLNVSAGTAVMRDLEGYRRISREWSQGWGQGLALAWLCELLRGDEGEQANAR